jgi:hypothetical protein
MRMPHTRFQAPWIPAALAAALALGACKAVQTVAETPVRMTQAMLPGGGKKELRPLTDMHPAVLSFADSCAERLRVETDVFAQAAGTPEARMQAIDWRLRGTRLLINSATGPVPLGNMLDLQLLLIGGRVLVQERWMRGPWAVHLQQLPVAFGELEERGWAILGEFLLPEQITKFRQVAADWEALQSGKGEEMSAQPPNFQEALKQLRTDEGTSSGLLGFIQLDPLAGLEPAAREVALSRQFAERMLFWAQRLSVLIEDEIELAVLRAQRLPEVEGVLADLARVSAAADGLATTAAGLPQQLSAEREAALKQLSEEVTAQREGLVRDLETAQAPLQTLLGESRQTFQAAAEMSTQLTAALVALDAFVGRFDKPDEPGAAGAAAPPAPDAEPDEPPGKPFDITEYGATAEQIGVAAGELRTLVAQLDESLPKVEQMVGTAAAGGKETVDHAFRRGLQLGLALIAAAALAALLVRWIGTRWIRRTA